MPNRPVHIAVGTLAGAAVIAFTPQENENIPGSSYFLGGLLGGYVGGIMPDIIDPPTSPNHRGFGHSVTGNAIGLSSLGYFIKDIDNWISDKINEAEAEGNTFLVVLLQAFSGFIRGFIAGQTSHLLMDLTTPKGLPL